MSLLVVGSVALDSVKTPFGERVEVLGGSATHFSMSASYFTQVNLVGVVGEDFPAEYLQLLRSYKIDLEGLKISQGKTFRWAGSYLKNINEAETLNTQLNVFQHFNPEIPAQYKECRYVFLANIDPELQLSVLEQVKNPKLVACDTMNYWIWEKRGALLETFKKINILIINEAETRELAEESNIVKAAKIILDWGPSYLIVKRGEYGVVVFTKQSTFSAPAYYLERVIDPTGAGDSFAGGFMGFLASRNGDLPFSDAIIRQATIMGSVMASYNVEDFSLERLKTLNKQDIIKRFAEFRELTNFDGNIS